MEWKNQFESVEQTELLRTTVEIPHKINALIKQFEPKTGVLQNTISILVEKLAHELRESNLEPGDRYAYQRAIANCTLQLDCGKRGTVTQPPTRHVDTVPAETSNRNDGRGSQELARQVAGTPQSSDVNRPHERNSKRSKTQTKQTKTKH